MCVGGGRGWLRSKLSTPQLFSFMRTLNKEFFFGLLQCPKKGSMNILIVIDVKDLEFLIDIKGSCRSNVFFSWPDRLRYGFYLITKKILWLKEKDLLGMLKLAVLVPSQKEEKKT